MKKLIITYTLSYDPIYKHAQAGNCTMKCPLGDCLLELVLLNSLDKITQSIGVKAERT